MNKGFAYLDEAVPGALCDAKYATADNFTGNIVDGYFTRRVVGSLELAAALRTARDAARALGFTLLLWDGYRPERAVRAFMRWAAAPEDGKTKSAHYPNIDKARIVPLGYVAERSGHSRGGAIDLTLCDGETGKTLDMGGDFDLMDAISHHGAAGVSEAAARNRATLRGIMERSGFAAYESEWWHYCLINEPHPDRAFDFPIQDGDGDVAGTIE